jgi:hypothetical protein
VLLKSFLKRLHVLLNHLLSCISICTLRRILIVEVELAVGAPDMVAATRLLAGYGALGAQHCLRLHKCHKQ